MIWRLIVLANHHHNKSSRQSSPYIVTDFFLVIRILKIYSLRWLSNRQYSVFNCSNRASHYICMTYFLYNWTLVPFDSVYRFWYLALCLWRPPVCSLYQWAWFKKNLLFFNSKAHLFSIVPYQLSDTCLVNECINRPMNSEIMGTLVYKMKI